MPLCCFTLGFSGWEREEEQLFWGFFCCFFFFQSMIGLIWDFGREGERERGLTQFNGIWGLKIEESRNIGRIILGAKGF